MKRFNIQKQVCLILTVLALFVFSPSSLLALDFSGLESRLGVDDGMMVADDSGRILFSHNARKRLVPASTLKLLTALYALDYLGADFRFQTEFYLQPASGRSKGEKNVDLVVKGYGDPLLVSEVLAQIAKTLAKKVSAFHDLVLDDTFFADAVTIPGVTNTQNPYDAPNGALCVNFNTVNFKRLNDGTFQSAEPQTPLLDFALKRIKASGLKRGRIIFPTGNHEHLMYAGHLMDYFFKQAGLIRHGAIRRLSATPKGLMLYRHLSPYPLSEVLRRLLEHSNNFIANQILITMGAKRFGPPGTLKKGVAAIKQYAKNSLGFKLLSLAEGSGISRQNRIAAAEMLKVLNRLAGHHQLLTRSGHDFFKTGTLHNISTRAGYIELTGGGLYRYVIFLNTPGKNAAHISRRLKQILKQ